VNGRSPPKVTPDPDQGALRRNGRRALLAAIIVLSAVVFLPATALAHAGLISATPEPGSELAIAPALVVLRFTEPLNVRLSDATVTTPDGERVAGRVTDAEEISVRLPGDARGVYDVSWTTVSLLDGHSLSGSFEFGVGVAVRSGATAFSSSPRMTDLLISIARSVEDLALMLAVGLLLLGRLARRAPALGWIRERPTAPLAVAFVAGTIVVLAEAFVAAQGLSVGPAVSYLTTGLPGLTRFMRPALELFALALAMHESRWTVLPMAGAIVVLAASGHAAATSPRMWAVILETVHVGTAAIWAGGIMALAFQRPPGGWRGDQGRVLLGRFTPVALEAFAVTAVAGVLRGAQEVGSLHELFASSYGDALLVKSSLVVLMAALSVFAWRRRLVTPRLESAVAIGVVATAALLAAYPLPPARLVEAEIAARSAAEQPGLPEAGDLTLGARAGDALVGLTLRPAEPGRNDLYLYALPFSGERAGSRLAVKLSIGGHGVGLEPCGMACLWTALDLSGKERIRVRVGGSDGGLATFDLPRLPAPDGGHLFGELEQRMHTLVSYRLDEALDSGTSTIRTSYACRAPDECRTRSSGGFQSVWIGGTLYLKRAPGAGWIVQPDNSPFQVSSFLWDYVPDRIVDPRIVGAARIGAVDTTILSFYGPLNGAPYWFRLWIDHTGLVRQAEMRGYAHFMDQRYSGFDVPITIAPPKGPGS
jgi:copper transport protein